MFTNHIQHFPDFARTPIPAAIPMLTNAIPELFPQVGNPAQGWGLTFMITQEAHTETGRGRNTGWWAGLSNLYWWCDRERGVAGMIATQILPFFGKPLIHVPLHPLLYMQQHCSVLLHLLIRTQTKRS